MWFLRQVIYMNMNVYHYHLGLLCCLCCTKSDIVFYICHELFYTKLWIAMDAPLNERIKRMFCYSAHLCALWRLGTICKSKYKHSPFPGIPRVFTQKSNPQKFMSHTAYQIMWGLMLSSSFGYSPTKNSHLILDGIICDADLIQCGLVTPCGGWDLGQHWLR